MQVFYLQNLHHQCIHIIQVYTGYRRLTGIKLDINAMSSESHVLPFNPGP